MKIKVLNLYAGIGGNRKLWENVEVTAVELNPQLAKIYSDYFPDDSVIVGNAHKYLEKHFESFDFIWASPPCPSHSKFRKDFCCNLSTKSRTKPIYPDLMLYEEIIFLQHYFKGKYVIENVQAYYNPLIKPQQLSRHWFWCNFILPQKYFKPSLNIKEEKTKNFGFDLSLYRLSGRKSQIINNCVDPDLGKYVFDMAYHVKQNKIMNYV